jgi:hypothetical protein
MTWAPELSGEGDRSIADYGVEVNIEWVSFLSRVGVLSFFSFFLVLSFFAGRRVFWVSGDRYIFIIRSPVCRQATHLFGDILANKPENKSVPLASSF